MKHNKNKFLIAAFSLVLLALANSASAALITYDIHRTVGSGSIDGFIQTDGTLGTIHTTNIVDFEFLLYNGVNSGVLTPDMVNPSNYRSGGTGWIATATELQFDFSGSGYVLINGNGFEWCIEAAVNIACAGASYESVVVNFSRTLEQLSGVHTIATLQPSAVPVPAAVWLMGSGLIGLIGVARRNPN